MDMQSWAVMIALLLAGGYLCLRMWRGWKRINSGGCSSSCGCEVKSPEAKQPGLVQAQDLTARLRTRADNR
jgi:hypothetical protein